MGALTSTPKSLPTIQPQVITLAEPVASAVATTTDTAATTDSGASTAAAAASDASTDTDAATAARQGSLLERSRGLLSTVLTGFDGILNNSSAPARKSLLGE